jgi:hypothetical protein
MEKLSLDKFKNDSIKSKNKLTGGSTGGGAPTKTTTVTATDPGGGCRDSMSCTYVDAREYV